MLMICILATAELGTEGAHIALGFDMLGFNVLPQPRFILGGPQTVQTLPQVSILSHFLCYFRMEGV